MSDSEWEQLLSSSPRDAYEYLIENYGNLVYAIVLNKLSGIGTREDIEDCISDIMVEFIRNAGKFSAENGSLKTYISTIAKYRAIDAFRRLAHHNNISLDTDEENITLISAGNTEEDAEKNIFHRKLWEIVRSLGEPDSSILIYQYFYNQKVSEVAGRLGMTAGAVQKRSIRARKKIKAILEKNGEYL